MIYLELLIQFIGSYDGGVMTFGWFLFIFFALFVSVGIFAAVDESKQVSKMTPAQRQSHNATKEHGPLSAQMICPHCQSGGKVHTKPITNKKGVSGGKATGALLTGGISLLATGLSRKEISTQAFCENCQSKWQF